MPEEQQPVRLVINGLEVESAPGRLLIDVAEEHNVFVPRFCYHPGLESVAACRMCLVEIEGSRRPLDPACVTPVADGMVVHTKSESAREAQESVLELLLINHPLDCPICDQGGECPLQDQALRFGPGKSRYTEEKRHFKKPLPISDLVVLDRERCVLCWRCTRFCDEISGDRFIDLMDRGSLTQINTAHDEPFESYFSGNTIQMCPVGALTSRSHRFLTRPWDLGSSASTCSHCAVGCSIAIEHRAGEVLRAQSLANDEVNVFWNCDKGRFGHRYASHPERLKAPLILREAKDGQRFEAVHWDAALDLIEGKLQSALSKGGPGSIGLIGGSHATNEDVYAASMFMREVVGTANLDFRTFDSGFPYDEFGEGHLGSTATLADLDSASAILWLGGDPEEQLPVLYLRIRKAVERGAKLIVIGPRKLSISRLGVHLTSDPGGEAQVIDALTAGESRTSSDAISRAREFASTGSLVVCAGQQFIGYSSPGIAPRVRRLLAARSAKLLLCVPNANSQGCMDMGLHPAGAAGFSGPQIGMSTGHMLEAAARGRMEMLWIMGADVLSDFPDARLAAAALSGAAFVVVSELFATDTARSADVVLPAASVAEKEGSFTNLERRIQKVNMAVPAPGVARADWQIFGDLAERMGHEWNWRTSRDVANQIARHIPTHAGFAWEELGEAPAPIRQAGDEPSAEGAWPFSWELRAVDATRRRGWVWPMSGHASGNGHPGEAVEPQRADTSPQQPAAQAGPSKEFPLALLAGRMLFDDGAMVSRSPELRNIRKPPFVELHPDEAKQRELHDGEAVVVRSPRGELQVTLRVSTDTAKGAAFIPYELAGFRANALLDTSQPINFVEVAR